jgi:hypothetical protein
VSRADVQEALFVASSSLVRAMPMWRTQPDSVRGQRVERALVRYFAKMAGREQTRRVESSLGRPLLAERGIARDHAELNHRTPKSIVVQFRQLRERSEAKTNTKRRPMIWLRRRRRQSHQRAGS